MGPEVGHNRQLSSSGVARTFEGSDIGHVWGLLVTSPRDGERRVQFNNGGLAINRRSSGCTCWA